MTSNAESSRRYAAANREKERARHRDYRRRTKEYRAGQLFRVSTMGAPLKKPTKDLRIKVPKHGLVIAVIPDVQARRDTPTNHLRAAGNYIVDHRPDVIVCIGDFADMPSLNRHDRPDSLSMEGMRYAVDRDSTRYAMDELMTPIHKARGYNPRKILTLGNHEDLIVRAVENNPRQLDGLISLDDLEYEQHGWEVYPFLQPVVIGGVAFCHYFPSGVYDRPITSPEALLRDLHMSAYAGHQQGRMIAFAKRADGKDLTAIISGSFYQHKEKYLSPFSNRHWRGMFFLHEVKDGHFDEMALGINYLLRRWL